METIARYRVVAEDIIEDIRSGMIPPGDPIPSVRGLLGGYHARSSGRSHGHMAMATAQRVHEVVKESGLVTNPREGAKRSSGKKTIVLPQSEWPTA